MANILVADDSEDTLALLSTLLEKGGFHVEQARGGEECLEIAALRRLDVTALSVTEIDVGAFRALSATLSLALTLVVATGARRAEMEKSACGNPK